MNETVQNEVAPEGKSKDQLVMILGIAAIGCYMMCSWMGYLFGGIFGIAAPILGIVAIIVAIKAHKQGQSLSGKGLAGLICGIWALYQSVMLLLAQIRACAVCLWALLLTLEQSGLLWDVILDFAPVLLGL
ncbi:MAG: hypothetical protein IJZ37_05350 [Clostridia bacterium]|nr:hypothetical protein [Clostridia bacterium]